jgi:hypothetical protein
VTSLASAALFTDTRATAASTVTTGDVALAVGGSVSSSFAVAALAPGDAKYGVVTVQDSGSLALRYSGQASWGTAGVLPASAQISMRSIASPTAPCDGSIPLGTGDIVTNVSASSTLSTSVAMFGSSSTGQQPGDRALAAATSESLCVRLQLPTSAGNAVANQTSTLAFQFAEQTINNP